MTRLLDLYGRELAALRGDALVESVRASEGRCVMAEIVSRAPPLLDGTSNAELAGAFGADLICLNLSDPGATHAPVTGLEELSSPPATCGELGRLLGRPVGLNLEPDIDSVPPAHRATKTNVAAARASDAAFLMITANPKRKVSMATLEATVARVASWDAELVCFAGKMHHAGLLERLDPKIAEALANAGARGVLVPLPGTVPGVGEPLAAAMVEAAHEAGVLAVGTIGTSQEGAGPETLEALALAAKRIGVDVHHIGDAGFTGVARPESLYAYSVAIRGIRHTWNRMARSVRASWG